MAQVFLNIHGNGTARVDNEYPTVDDPVFTVYAFPLSHEDSFLRMQAWTHDDRPIATPDGNPMTLRWRSVWGNVYVDVYFTGSEPPEPPTPTPTTENWFLVVIAKAANRWRI